MRIFKRSSNYPIIFKNIKTFYDDIMDCFINNYVFSLIYKNFKIICLLILNENKISVCT
jgi:hypothetical protein